MKARALRMTTALPALAPAAFVSTFLVASTTAEGYSYMSNTVSALATHGHPNASLASAGFIGYGLMVLPLGYLFAKTARVHGHSVVGIVLAALFVLYGISDIFAGIFSDDLAGQSTVRGFLHDLFARAGYAAVTATMVFFTWAVRGVPEFRRLARFAEAMALLTLLLGLAFITGAWGVPKGLAQLGFFGTTLAWVQVSSVRLRCGSSN